MEELFAYFRQPFLYRSCVHVVFDVEVLPFLQVCLRDLEKFLPALPDRNHYLLNLRC